jgi:ferredoxin
MTDIVAEPCIKCKHTACVAVCPVNCFYEGENMLIINPSECIDCAMCEPVCPSKAIFEVSNLPEEWDVYREINAVFSGSATLDDVYADAWPAELKASVSTWPSITEEQAPLPGAAVAKTETNKLRLLSPKPASR